MPQCLQSLAVGGGGGHAPALHTVSGGESSGQRLVRVLLLSVLRGNGGVVPSAAACRMPSRSPKKLPQPLPLPRGTCAPRNTRFMVLTVMMQPPKTRILTTLTACQPSHLCLAQHQVHGAGGDAAAVLLRGGGGSVQHPLHPLPGLGGDEHDVGPLNGAQLHGALG